MQRTKTARELKKISSFFYWWHLKFFSSGTISDLSSHPDCVIIIQKYCHFLKILSILDFQDRFLNQTSTNTNILNLWIEGNNRITGQLWEFFFQRGNFRTLNEVFTNHTIFICIRCFRTLKYKVAHYHDKTEGSREPDTVRAGLQL